MKRIIMFGFLLFLITPCFSEEVITLDDIVLTPYSGFSETTVSLTPYSAKVYTSDVIEQTGSKTVLDFLKKVSSLHISDYYGTGVKTTVDMMGFGDNAASNILILVNGRRVNDIDMSGTDWTQLSLKDVEKIELIKGGGVVLFGDNAAGGVINLITKDKITKGLNSEIDFEAGSYRYTKESLALSGGNEKISFYGFSEYHSTDGYRQNSHYRSKFASLKINSKINEGMDLTFDASHHEYVYGLPDDITESESAGGYSLRDSTTPLNNDQREDNTLGFTIKNEFYPGLKAMVDVYFRNRNELEELLSYSLTTDKHTSSIQVRPQILFSFNTFSLKHETISGFELYSCDLSSDTAGATTDIDRQTLAGFVQDNIAVNDKFSIRLGSRLQREKFTFDYTGSTSTDDGLNFTEDLYEAGLNYELNKKNNFYLNFSKGLRVGKTDEYLVTWPSASVNTGLSPQRSKSVTAGINSQINEMIEVSFDYFQTSIHDEIYYDPATWTNKNYDQTRRQGVNFDVSFTPSDNLGFNAGYRFVDAEFREGAYAGKKVPFVPKSIFTAAVKYQFFKNFSLFVDYIYRGKTYLINDLNNISPKLKSYNITNLKLSYSNKEYEIFAGVNNIFNEFYSEYAATNISGTTRGFYPSPVRNYFGGVKLKF